MFFYDRNIFHIFSLSCASVFSDLHFLVSELCRRVLSAVYSINLAVQNVILKPESSTKYCISAYIHNMYPEIVYCSIVALALVDSSWLILWKYSGCWGHLASDEIKVYNVMCSGSCFCRGKYVTSVYTWASKNCKRWRHSSRCHRHETQSRYFLNTCHAYCCWSIVPKT